MARRHSSDSRSDIEDGYKPKMSSKIGTTRFMKGAANILADQFAPPSSLSFAPPPPLDSTSPPPPPDDATGEDAFARRMRLVQHVGGSDDTPPPPPPPAGHDTMITAQPPASSAPAPTISRAPVRYNLPHPPSELPSSEAELATALETEQASFSQEPQEADEEEDDAAPRSLRPGQKGFAERLMSKYGWSKGSGLGAGGSGIVNPLRVQVEKQKKKPDSEGGGFAGPGGMGKILGGKRKGDTEEGGKFGAMSEVVVLRGMVDGMDLDAEMGGGDGGLMQEIGEECGEKVSAFPTMWKTAGNGWQSLIWSSMDAWKGCSLIAATRLRRPSL